MSLRDSKKITRKFFICFLQYPCAESVCKINSNVELTVILMYNSVAKMTKMSKPFSKNLYESTVQWADPWKKYNNILAFLGLKPLFGC